MRLFNSSIAHVYSQKGKFEQVWGFCEAPEKIWTDSGNLSEFVKSRSTSSTSSKQDRTETGSCHLALGQASHELVIHRKTRPRAAVSLSSSSFLIWAKLRFWLLKCVTKCAKCHKDSKMCFGLLGATRTRIQPIIKPSRHFAHFVTRHASLPVAWIAFPAESSSTTLVGSPPWH